MRLRDSQFRCAFLAAALAGLTALVADPAGAALPVKAELVVSAAANAVDIVYAGDGSAQLYVVDQAGRIRILRSGALLATPFLDIGSLVAFGGEQGLLGLAFHPQYATNGKFYVNYTRAGDGATVVASYRVSAADHDRADPASRIDVLTIAQPYANHNGGAVRFGPDGYLYIGMGDGGSAGDPENRAQNTQELLGKMLRIDVDGATPYAIPAANPFVAGGGRREIFAIGLRNPWRFSFDRGTGDLYIGDVGQGAIEEIDFLPKGQGAGANFGWRVMEGNQCTNYGGNPPCNPALFTPPVLTYDHNQGCSVTGGVVYRGRKVPVLYGRYLYSDYCSGHLWAAARDRNGVWQTEVILETGHHVGTIGEDVDGEVYWTDLTGGSIYRLVADASVPIAIEYFNATLGHYFLTASPEEAAALDGGAFAGAWRRTGYAFVVGSATDGDAVPVCRFFGKPGVGPNSHFYTGYPQECAGLKDNPLWIFEGIGFLIRVPVNDACAPILRPVYRLYNNPATLAQVNHRFTADGATYNAMRAAGWIGEGVAFCAK
jgi:glucose/arabinose dehydrogenase